ncbi:MAG: allantoinase AllB [Planctomycetota bacterium]
MKSRTVVRSRRVFLPAQTRPADVPIIDGIIQSIDPYGQSTDDVIDVGNHAVLPGLVDTHVHLNDPGRETWEGFDTGTRAARAGGITTLVDMPLNSSPVTTSAASLDAKATAAAGRLHVDVAAHAGLVPENASEISDLIHLGCFAAKSFLCPSGIDEFPHVTEEDLRIGMAQLASADKPLLAHAEVISSVPAMQDPRCYDDYLRTRPERFERDAIGMLLDLAAETGCHIHIVHLSDAGSLPMIRSARDSGIRVTVETCPHYLCLDAESVPDGATQFKCAPPIRSRQNQSLLWEALIGGEIDMVVSDHSPCPPDLKHLDDGRFDLAWGGVSSLELGLPLIWTHARQRGASLRDVIQWMSIAPAELVGVSSGIEVGNRAHLAVFDEDASWTVDQCRLQHRHAITPYHGMELRGQVIQTFVHGMSDDRPHGRWLSVLTIDGMNHLSPRQAIERWKSCCGSTRWCSEMAARRPMGCVADIHAAADECFSKLTRDDWLEAFECHPKLGDLESLRMKYAGNRQWSSGEQSGVAAADDATLKALADGNQAYEQKFGYLFILCASGKSAADMLASLQSRIGHSHDHELNVAAAEQTKITHLRIDKLLAHSESTS